MEIYTNNEHYNFSRKKITLCIQSAVAIATKPHQKYANYANDSNIVVRYFFFYVASNVWQNGNGPGAIYYNIILCKSAIVLQCFLC